jgi:hypothetical protein
MKLITDKELAKRARRSLKPFFFLVTPRSGFQHKPSLLTLLDQLSDSRLDAYSHSFSGCQEKIGQGSPQSAHAEGARRDQKAISFFLGN